MKNQLALSLALALTLSTARVAFADDDAAAKSKAPQKQNENKVDISDLENKYWAPKDTDFSVVQNRTYSKKGRFFLTPSYGILVNDAYSTGSIFGLTANYFWSERSGVQLMYQGAHLKDNDTVSTLQSFGKTGVAPDHDRLNSFYGLGYNFVPFYAKMSFLNNKIIYFDMAITPVVGMTSYDQLAINGSSTKSALTYGVDISQFFFFTNHFAIRADLNNHWTNEAITSYTGNENGSQVSPGTQVGTKNNLDTTFLIGATFFY